MNRLEAINDAFLLSTGKATTPDGAKLATLQRLAVKLYRDWQTEPGVEWESLSRDVSAGTVSATATVYDLSEDINFISKDENNYVKINNVPYKVVSSAQLQKYRHGRAVAHVVVDGQHSIKFSQPFVAGSDQIGKEILVPCIIKLDDILKDTDEILIDDPNWLPAMMAAYYVRPNRQLNYLYDDLLAAANELMVGMKEKNSPGNATTSTGVDYFGTLGNVGNTY